MVSGAGEQELETDFEAAFRYLEEHTEIRDVLLSGGDPLLFSDQKLEKILSRLRSIPHIEFLRIGSRVPVFLPQRITPEFCQMLQKYHPLFLSIHVNHPRELTIEVKEGLERLANHGVPMGNQSVLLRGVNDDVETMRVLVISYSCAECALITSINVTLFKDRPICGLQLVRGLKSLRGCAVTPVAMPFRSLLSMLQVVEGKFRLILIM